jgi:hypothetical protein
VRELNGEEAIVMYECVAILLGHKTSVDEQTIDCVTNSEVQVSS